MIRKKKREVIKAKMAQAILEKMQKSPEKGSSTLKKMLVSPSKDLPFSNPGKNDIEVTDDD